MAEFTQRERTAGSPIRIIDVGRNRRRSKQHVDILWKSSTAQNIALRPQQLERDAVGWQVVIAEQA